MDARSLARGHLPARRAAGGRLAVGARHGHRAAPHHAGTGRINWRLTPERLLVRLGLAEVSDRTASEVDAHRRLTRVALAAKRAKALREGGASERKMRAALAKLDKAMDQAVEHTGLAVDAARQEALLAQIAALYNTSALIDADPARARGSRGRPPPGARRARRCRPALVQLVDDDDEDVRDPRHHPAGRRHRPAGGADARRPGVLGPADRAKGIVPRTVDIAQEIGISLATAREYRALWKLEPRGARAHRGRLPTSTASSTPATFPAIAADGRVLTKS